MILASLLLTAVMAPEPPPSDYSISETRKLIHAYGTCVVKNQQRRASEAILRNLDNSNLLRSYPQLIDGACLLFAAGAGAQARFTGDEYRYALADGLVRRTLADAPPPQLDAVPRLDHREPEEAPSKLDKKGRPLKPARYEAAVLAHQQKQAYAYLSRYGECVVRSNPAGARALLLSEPSTAEENSRFGDLRTALGTCLPEGASLQFGKLALRGTIAVNYYRLAMAARGAGSVAQ
jgi:hypothetical protein